MEDGFRLAPTNSPSSENILSDEEDVAGDFLDILEPG